MIKTIGDEVMVVGSDPSALVDWAVGFQLLYGERRPLPRIGIHAGGALYRDGDYYGRAVNLASRVGARAAGGEVLVTRPVVEAAGATCDFEHIGEVRLKGFDEPTELFLAASAEERVSAAAVEARVRAGGLLAAGRAGAGAALGRARLGLPARPRGPARRPVDARCTSTTGCATRRPPTRRSARRCASGSACR